MAIILNGSGTITGLSAGGLPDSSVTTAELANGAVTTLKIADANVTTAKIADANVTTAKIADANVTVAKLSATGTPSATTYLRGDGTWGTPAGGVTSITAGSGLTGGTITGSGTIALDVYTGSTKTNSVFPVGTYVFSNLTNIPNTAATLYSPATGNMVPYDYQFRGSSTGAGSVALAGTWRARGSAMGEWQCGFWYSGGLYQRVA